MSAPSTDWVFEPGLADAALVAVTAGARPTTVTEGTNPAEVHIAADGTVPLGELAQVVRARGPGLRRVFLVVRSDGDWFRLRFLVNVTAPDATLVKVESGAPPGIRRYPSGERPPARFSWAPPATVTDLVNAAGTAGARTRILDL